MRVGFYGGTFDPVHLGHVEMIQAAVTGEYGIEHCIVMPCHLSPHKLDGRKPTHGRHRLAMLELALSGIKRVQISSYELEQNEVSYTWQTLAWLKKKWPGFEVTLIIGEDQLKVLHKWTRIESWANEVTFLVFSRKSDADVLNQSEIINSLSITHAKEKVADVSATEIRTSMAQGKSIDALVLPTVAQYISENQLYL